MKVSKHFNRKEFFCHCGCGFDAVDTELLSVLEDVREAFNAPVTITSGCRCHVHNRAVGSTETSQHIKAKAADIKVKGISTYMVFAYLNEKYLNKYGIGKYKDFVHIDVRSKKARWYN